MSKRQKPATVGDKMVGVENKGMASIMPLFFDVYSTSTRIISEGLLLLQPGAKLNHT